jgi:hypothetical protein
MRQIGASTPTLDPATRVDSRRGALQPVDLSAAIPLGAHLVTPRCGFTHHGIYVGNGRVVQYTGLSRSLRGGPVQEVSLAEFENCRGVAIASSSQTRYPPDVVVERARSRLGENAYRIATNNCEHFSSWCLRGEGRSEQIDRFLRWPRAIAALLARARRASRTALTGALDLQAQLSS